MGFWKRLKQSITAPLSPAAEPSPASPGSFDYIKEYIKLSEQCSGPTYPLEDNEGNEISNIMAVNITGVTHIHLSSNPQKIIPTLGQAQLALVPDLNNQFDDMAIRVLTQKGKQIGWFPQAMQGRELIHQRLMEKRYIYAEVFDKGHNRNSNLWWCKIRLVLYATPYDKSLIEKNAERYISEKQEFYDQMLELYRAGKDDSHELSGIELDYKNTITKIIMEAFPKLADFVVCENTGDFFAVHLAGATSRRIFSVKLTGRLKYCLVPISCLELAKEKAPNLSIAPASKTEGANFFRLGLPSCEDIINLKDIIIDLTSIEIKNNDVFLYLMSGSIPVNTYRDPY